MRTRFHFILLIAFLAWYSTPAYSQFYEIFGPQDISLCSQEYYTYGIETSAQLVRTTWEIIPTSGALIISSDLTSAVVQYYAPGTYILIASSLTVNQDSLTDSLMIYVNGITAPPEVLGCFEASDSTDCRRVCAFSQTTIIFPAGSNATWQVTGAQSYTQNNPSSIEITWGAGGPGSVSIYNQGCDSYLCFDILPQPIADFITTPPAAGETLTVCKNQEVYFENLSVNGLSYLWQFGDGNQSDGYDASHTYTAEGFYTVTLTANSVCDCSADKQLVVEVLPAPAPMLDCVNSVCPETRQRYTVTPSGCASYTWSVSSNGTIVNGGELTDDFIEVIWHEGPDGIIQLSVSGCATAYCSFTNTFRVPIISPEGPIEGDASVCSGELTTYTAPYFPGTQYFWQVGPSGTILGGQNTNGVTVRWDNVNNPVSTSVEVYYTNCFLECNGQDFINVAITPEIRLQGDLQVCQNETATVTAEAGFNVFSPVNVRWHVEDAAGNTIYTAPGLSPSFSYTFNTTPGLYSIVATNSAFGYCTESIARTIQVTATPDVPLGITGEQKICPGQPYGYTIVSAGNFATQWVITDGGSTYNYLGETCQHTFGPVPPYIVTANHADIQFQGCVSSSISLVLGTAADLSIIGPDEVCFNEIDSFTTGFISGADYTWEVIPADHGEIRRSDLNKVEVFWTQAGNATLRLHACGISIDKTILVHALPAFNVVGPLAACANELVSLTTDQSLLPHIWVDENQSIIGVQNNIQLPPGSFGVEITDGFGCTNEKSFQVTSYPAPVVHLSSAYEETYCTNIPGGVEVVANTDGADYTYEWFLDDVSIGPGGPVFAVTTFGAYHVEVTNQYGCKAASQKISFADCCVSPCGAPIPGLPGGCALLFNDFSIVLSETECNIHEFTPNIAGLTPGSINWFIRSNSEGYIAVVNADNLNYTYQKPGYYHVTMTALLNGFPYDANSCGHYQQLTDTVRAVADFKHDGICAGSSIVFEDLTTFIPGESIATWSWDFDDPASGGDNTSSLQNPTHIFNTAGTYEVTLVATLTSGCSTTKKQMVTISGGPVLNPVYDPQYCEAEAMSFQLPGDVYDIQWGFGDPASGTENSALTDSVFHTFNLPGFYPITVSGADINACVSQSTFMVDIVANTLSGIIDVDPITPLCSGDSATLTAPAGGLSWSWSTSESTPQIVVAESNQYNVLIRDQYNCTYSPPAVFVEVFPKPEVIIKAREIYGPDDFGPWSSSLHICYGTEFELSAFSTGNVSYHWSDGSVTQVIQFTNEGANIPPPGLYEYTVTTTDLTSGCLSDTSAITLEIFALPDVPVINIMSGSGCSFNPNILQVTNPQAGITYVWSDGQEGVSITADQAGPYLVTAINSNGCSSESNTITINASLPVDQLPGGCFIACDPLTVCLPPFNGVASYTIYQDGNVFLSGGNNWPANFVITSDGSYTIEVTNFNGCTAVSDPLDVVLYTGVGSITVETWLDQDGDGLISGGDVLLPGIPVQIISDDGLQMGSTETVPGGQFVFEDYPSANYLALIDRTLLSSQWKVVIDSVTTQIATCDDSVVVSLLLMQNCTTTGPDQLFELCPGELLTLGDSTWSDTGTYVMHMNSVSGCDSVFQVSIIAPDSIGITGVVWVDVDHSGTVTPADTLAPGITLVLTETSTGITDVGVTDNLGVVLWNTTLTNYTLEIDTALLAASFLPVIYEATIEDTLCGAVTIDLLIESACPTVFVIQQNTLCPGDSVLIEGQWISSAGQYTFTHSDPVTLCDTVINVTVSVTEEIVVQSMVDWNCITLGSVSLDLSGVNPFMIVWSNGVTGDTSIAGLDPGTYSVLITDGNGCTTTDTFTVVSSPLLMFDVPSSYTVPLGDSVLITITGDTQTPGLTYDWTPPGILSCPTCPSSLAFPEQNTVVTIQITDADSCVYFLETAIVVTSDTSSLDQIYVPNVFSPNGDGVNDYWTIFSKLEDTYVHQLVVFDRWGSLVYHKEEFVLNTINGWDGTLKGKPMNPGVFAYTARLTLGDGRDVVVKGDVTLVR